MIELLESLGFIVHRNSNDGVEPKYTVVTYYNETPAFHASGKLQKETQYVQVDLYSKGDTDADKELIKTTLRNAGVSIVNIQERRDGSYNRVIFDCVVTAA